MRFCTFILSPAVSRPKVWLAVASSDHHGAPIRQAGARLLLILGGGAQKAVPIRVVSLTVVSSGWFIRAIPVQFRDYRAE